jgi:hypothetical protein
MWYKTAKIGFTKEQLNRKLKELVRKDSFFKFMFKEFEVPFEAMDNGGLTFMAKKLNGKFAESNGKFIFLNEKLFEKDNFFANGIHFVVHELLHWLTRQREKDFYFTDPEEIDAFAYGMAHEMQKGKGKEHIERVFYPIIKAHFKKKKNATKIFNLIFKLALRKQSKMKNNLS